MRYLFDTGSAGDFINHRRGVFDRAKAATARGHRIGVGMPVLGELFAGIEVSKSRDRNLVLLNRVVSTWTIWPFDLRAAQEFGRIFAELRRIGRPMQQIDIQIAAIARSLGNCTVVSSDSDLKAVPKLDVEDWAS